MLCRIIRFVLGLWAVVISSSSLSFGESCLDRYGKLSFNVYSNIQYLKYKENLRLVSAARKVLNPPDSEWKKFERSLPPLWYSEFTAKARLWSYHGIYQKSRSRASTEDFALLIYLADQFGLLCDEQFGYPKKFPYLSASGWGMGSVSLLKDFQFGALPVQIFVSYVTQVVESLSHESGIADFGAGELDNPRDGFSRTATDIHSKITTFLGSKDHEALEAVSSTVGRKSRNLNSTYWQGWMEKADLFLTSHINDQIRYKELPSATQVGLAKAYSIAVLKLKKQHPEALEVLRPAIQAYLPAGFSSETKNHEKTEIASRGDSEVIPESKSAAEP